MPLWVADDGFRSELLFLFPHQEVEAEEHQPCQELQIERKAEPRLNQEQWLRVLLRPSQQLLMMKTLIVAKG